MKNAPAVLAVLALSGFVFAQDPPPTTPPASTAPATEGLKAATGPDLGEAAAGEVIYMRYCAACHGRSLKGDGPVASGLNKKPIDLTQLTRKNNGTFPFDKVAAMIDGRQSTRMHGSPDMPVWGEIFAMTKGTDAPSAELAVKRITNYVWTQQAKAEARN
ncbi:MAG: c-type cytochrome [Vicinamibacteria bacterium]